jgi:hypothetical protein
MLTRCYNRKWHGWQYYGGKGVVVCNDWLSFVQFKAWAIGHGFKPGLTIDRLNAGGNYEPNNCEWVTRVENIRRMHIARGHKMSVVR